MARAAAYDLDALQQLALADVTILGYTKQLLRRPPAAWESGALALTQLGRSDLTTRPQAADVAERIQVRREAISPDRAPAPNRRSPQSSADAAAPMLLPPLSPEDRAALREHLVGSWRWSDRLPLLLAFYRCHGWGLTSQHQVLRWDSDGLVPASMPKVRGLQFGGFQNGISRAPS